MQTVPSSFPYLTPADTSIMPLSLLTHPPQLSPSRSSHVHQVPRAIRAAKLLISSTPSPSVPRQSPSAGQDSLQESSSSPASSTAGTRSRSPDPPVVQTSRKHRAPSVDARSASHRRRGSYPRRTRTSTCPYFRQRRAVHAR